MNLLKIHKFAFKNVIFTTTKYEMYLKILQKPCYPGCIFSKQAKPCPEENNVEFFEGQIRTAKLSFVHKKKSEHFFEIKILNLEQRETLALVKKFDIGRPRRPS